MNATHMRSIGEIPPQSAVAARSKFSAVDARTLRAAVGSFCDLLGLATRTLEAFGPGSVQT